VKPIEAEVLFVSEAGAPDNTGASGAVASIVHEVEVAELVLPAASVALTARLCSPSARSVNSFGDVQAS
jgi:hypothetical protein